jgi:hypothetical protein
MAKRADLLDKKAARPLKAALLSYREDGVICLRRWAK